MLIGNGGSMFFKIMILNHLCWFCSYCFHFRCLHLYLLHFDFCPFPRYCLRYLKIDLIFDLYCFLCLWHSACANPLSFFGYWTFILRVFTQFYSITNIHFQFFNDFCRLNCSNSCWYEKYTGHSWSLNEYHLELIFFIGGFEFTEQSQQFNRNYSDNWLIRPYLVRSFLRFDL